MGMTAQTASVLTPLPSAVQMAFPPAVVRDLFSHLCVESPRRLQLSAGLLLTRIAGTQQWWGGFLGHMLQDFFSASNLQNWGREHVARWCFLKLKAATLVVQAHWRAVLVSRTTW